MAGQLQSLEPRVNPRQWSGRHIALLILLWVVGVLFFTFRWALGFMTASGPTGALVGISVGALTQLLVLLVGPPLLLFLAWRAVRPRPKPPAI